MTRLLCPTVLVGMGLLSPAASQEPAAPDDRVDAFIRAEMTRRQIPGLAVAVIRDGQVIEIGAYGTASVEYGTPVTTDTLFNVASVTKAFTGMGILRLVEDRTVALEDPIGRHLTDLPSGWRAVPVRRLLNHTSGLPVIDADPYSMRTRAQTVPAALSLLSAEPLESGPGTKWTYNQTNYMVLGMLIEKLSGRTFTEFVAERLFNPLGVHTATFGDSRAVVPNRATIYTRFRYDTNPPQRLDDIEVLSYETPVFNYPAGGLNISIREFTRWLVALDQGTAVSTQSLNELWRPATFNDGSEYLGAGPSWTSYGLGWTLNLGAGHPTVGGTGGLRAGFAVYPRDRLAVVVLTNLQGAGPDSLVDGVAALYLGAISK